MHLIEVENFEMRITEEFFLAKPLRELYNKYYQKEKTGYYDWACGQGWLGEPGLLWR